MRTLISCLLIQIKMKLVGRSFMLMSSDFHHTKAGFVLSWVSFFNLSYTVSANVNNTLVAKAWAHEFNCRIYTRDGICLGWRRTKEGGSSDYNTIHLCIKWEKRQIICPENIHSSSFKTEEFICDNFLSRQTIIFYIPYLFILLFIYLFIHSWIIRCITFLCPSSSQMDDLSLVFVQDRWSVAMDDPSVV